jgi:MoaA/NifB/PqqE/SkfB family radical SAM enzyme
MMQTSQREIIAAAPNGAGRPFPGYRIDTDASLDTIGAALDEARSRGHREVFFPDGELLARDDWKSILRLLHSRTMTFGLRTDGRILGRPEAVRKLIRTGLRHVRVLLPAGSAQACFLVTGQEILYPLLDRIRMAAREGLNLELVVPVSATNRGTLKAAVKIADSLPGAPPVVFELSDDSRFLDPVMEAVSYRRQLYGEGIELLPSRLVFSSTGKTIQLDPCVCPWKRAVSLPEDPATHLLIQQERNRYEFFRTDAAIPLLDLFFIRCVQQSVFKIEPEGTVRYQLVDACRSCSALIHCHPCYVAVSRPVPLTGTGAQPPSAATPGATMVREYQLDQPLARLSELRQRMGKLDVGEQLLVSGRQPVILLDGQSDNDDVTLAPTALGVLTDMASCESLHPVDYRLPQDETGQFQLTWERRTGDRHPVQDRLAVLTLSSACVAECVMCSLPRTYGGRALDSPAVFSALQQLKILGFTAVNLIGGTNHMRPDHLQVVRCAKAFNMYTLLVSPGFDKGQCKNKLHAPRAATCPDRDAVDGEAATHECPECSCNGPKARVEGLCAAGLDLLELDLDAHNAVLHDALRRRQGMFEGTILAYDLARASGNIHVGMNTIVLRDNIKLLPTIHQFVASRLKVKRHRMFFFVQIPSELTDPGWPGYEQCLEFITSTYPKLMALSQELGTSIDFRPPIHPEDLRNPQEFATRISGGNPSWKCQCADVGRDVMVMPDGTLYGCISPMILGDRKPLGNVGSDRIVDCLRNEAMAQWAEKAGQWNSCRLCLHTMARSPMVREATGRIDTPGESPSEPLEQKNGDSQ